MERGAAAMLAPIQADKRRYDMFCLVGSSLTRLCYRSFVLLTRYRYSLQIGFIRPIPV